MSNEIVTRPEPSDEAAERALVAALRQREGKATLGDLVVATGLPKQTAENVLRSMLSRYRSHLAVDENGELLYLFDRAMRAREGEGKLRRALQRAATFLWWLFTLFCKVGVMVVLVGYFILFVALALAAVVASLSGGNKRESRGGDAGGLVFLVFRVVLQIFIITDVRRIEVARRGVQPKPFYKKVFSFAFGPEAAEQWGLPRPENPRAFERGLLGAVRKLLGVISPTELVRYTGWSLRTADEESTRLLVAYEGEPVVTDDGQILYRFPSLLASAGGPAAASAEPWYTGREQPRKLTGNPTGTNVFIGFMNAFNMAAAGLLTYGWYTEPELAQIPIWLTWVPLFFSLMLFVVPVLRSFGVARENRRRRQRNVRRALLAELFRDADRGNEPRLDPRRLPREAVQAAGGDERFATAEVEKLLRDLEGEPEATDEGVVLYRFPRLQADLRAARLERKQVDPASLRVGELVYSSED